MSVNKILYCFVFLTLSVQSTAGTVVQNSKSLTDNNVSTSSLSLDDINKELEQIGDIGSDLASTLRKYRNDMQSSLSKITEETNKGEGSDQNKIDQLTKEYEEAKQKAEKIIETIRKRKAERPLPTDLPPRTNIESVGYGTNCPIHKKKRNVASTEENLEDNQSES
ncbi:MAG: hypothetical protein LBP31_02590 [Holosporales bacterium]|jgi:uncharacterized phage infection (PIP) family protein YhgE|nr:hypothetical protein [Holosporales bacterium]